MGLQALVLELLLEDCQQQGLGFGLQPLEVLPTLLQVQQFCVGSWYQPGLMGTIFGVGLQFVLPGFG